MPADLDHFEAYYADKLWQLLPSVYRAQDSTDFNRNGPLREMVNRIGAQAAILRRGIDRLWEDQSIETCDDWVIAYIGDLLATNLVSSQNAAGQRVDVAKTIYYRRRKGTMALLEELAYDVTRWDVRVVEFFRRLGRTRHNFDPKIGAPAETSDPASARVLQRAEGLLGKLTGSPIGGWADLRKRVCAPRWRFMPWAKARKVCNKEILTARRFDVPWKESIEHWLQYFEDKTFGTYLAEKTKKKR